MKENKALEEIGKGLISFANLFTTLSIINIYLKNEEINIYGIIFTVYTFLVLYFIGYNLIKRSN